MAFLNLLALTALSVLIISNNFTPVNALSADSGHVARHLSHAHRAIAKRKRAQTSRRCKPRPSPKPAPPPKPASVDSAVTSPSSNNPPKQPSNNNSSGKPKPNNSSNNNSNNNSGAGNNGNNNSGGGNNNSGGGQGKVGLAWPNGDDPSLSKFVTNKVGWIYTWSPYKPKAADSLKLNYMPQFWGDKPGQADDFKRLVVAGYAQYALGFNEPNQQGQADMTPQRGVDLWLQYFNPLKSQGYTNISPATTSAPSGKKWMQDFVRICNGRCNVDAVALHYYDVTASGFIKYVEDFHNTFKLPIYVTEFACQNFNGGAQPNQQQVDDFMDQVTSWMDQTDYVKGYFAFGVMHDMQNVNQASQLMAPNGGPTALGFKYIN